MVPRFLHRRRLTRVELERRLSNLRRSEEHAVGEYEARSKERLHSIINHGERAHAELRLVTAVGGAHAMCIDSSPDRVGQRSEEMRTREETQSQQEGNRPHVGAAGSTGAQFGLTSRSIDSRPSIGNPVTPWWKSAYNRAARLTDLLVIALGLRIALFLNGDQVVQPWSVGLAAGTGVFLVASMLAFRAWDGRTLGQGPEEFRRLGQAVCAAAVLLGLVGLAASLPALQLWVFGALPATGAALLVARALLRRVLHSQRRRGRCMFGVLAAGSPDEVADLIDRARREPNYGWEVVAVCVPGGENEHRDGNIRGVPIVGDLADVAKEVLQGGGYRVVAVAPDPYWTRRRLRDLSWQLEDTLADLVVAPPLMEVTGPRLHVAPVYGLTLLRVSRPSFNGWAWILKALIDRVISAAALLVWSPAFLAIAIAIKLEDGGPVLFRQSRVGKDGRPFTMLKFRSMVVAAEARLSVREEAVKKANEGAGPLFKLRQDPRVTRVGHVLRRYSLDELPQLLNVLCGHMSLVGPRPPLPVEVERYGFDARRRLRVKPGLSGLWQVSGRSDLSWEETVRLDLRYVENWSFAMDLVILWKTASAVLRSNGPY